MDKRPLPERGNLVFGGFSEEFEASEQSVGRQVIHTLRRGEIGGSRVFTLVSETIGGRLFFCIHPVSFANMFKETFES